MEKITLSEMFDTFRKHNRETEVTHQFDDKNSITGVVVFKNGPWFKKEFTEIERSYAISSDNKAFIAGMGGNSIFATCLDGTEPCVRLDSIFGMWEVDYCYIKED